MGCRSKGLQGAPGSGFRVKVRRIGFRFPGLGLRFRIWVVVSKLIGGKLEGSAEEHLTSNVSNIIRRDFAGGGCCRSAQKSYLEQHTDTS